MKYVAAVRIDLPGYHGDVLLTMEHFKKRYGVDARVMEAGHGSTESSHGITSVEVKCLYEEPSELKITKKYLVSEEGIVRRTNQVWRQYRARRMVHKLEERITDDNCKLNPRRELIGELQTIMWQREQVGWVVETFPEGDGKLVEEFIIEDPARPLKLYDVINVNRRGNLGTVVRKKEIMR